MRVAVRTDASARVGTGHLRRCLSLARALNGEGVATTFVCRRHDATAAAIEAEDQAHVLLPPPAGAFRPEPGDPPHASWAGVPWETDAAETVAALAGLKPDWLLVDHYGLDARWHRHVARALGCRIAAIDDLADRPLAVDLLVDHNLVDDPLAKYAGRIVPATRVLSGPRYALLAHRYASAPRYRFRRRAGSIGIFMGGSDPDDFGGRVLRACREHAGFTGPIELVASSRGPHFARQQELAGRWPSTRVLADLPDLCDFFARHDLQIGSGGGAAWERCCLGAPALAMAIASNQATVLPQLAARGAIDYLPDGGDPIAIGAAVRRLLDDPRRRLALVRASRGLVDGQGSARVAAVLAAAMGAAWRFRPAEPSDEALLLAWANDPEVRRNAFDSAPIPAAAHAAWFRRRLAQSDAYCIVIACSGAGVPAGQVRFEREAGRWTIDYSLDAAFRGWGHARRLLAGAIAVLREREGGAEVTGLVKPANEASLRAFRSLGFTERIEHHADLACHRFVLSAPTLQP